MKTLLALVPASLFLGAAMANDMPGGACSPHGAYSTTVSTSSASIDTNRCENGKWVQFEKGGEKQVLIAYEVWQDTEKLYSGSVITRDGQPASWLQTAEAPGPNSDSLVSSGGVFRTSKLLLLAPRLSDTGLWNVHVNFSESIETVTSDRQADMPQSPLVSSMGVSTSVDMDPGQELVIPLTGDNRVGTKPFALKLVATAL